MSLIEWMLGAEDSATQCKWCKGPINRRQYSQIRICESCVALAHRHASEVFCCNKHDGMVLIDAYCEHRPKYPWPGNLWEKMWTDSPVSAELFTKEVNGSISHADLAQNSVDAATDLLAMQRRVLELNRQGNAEEAAALNQQCKLKAKQILQFQAGIDGIVQGFKAASGGGGA